jgi:hypothetical protein
VRYLIQIKDAMAVAKFAADVAQNSLVASINCRIGRAEFTLCQSMGGLTMTIFLAAIALSGLISWATLGLLIPDDV